MKKYDPEIRVVNSGPSCNGGYTEIIEGRGTKNGGVFLDISHKPKEFIIDKLPRMYRQFLDTLMIDISKTLGGFPTAHYSIRNSEDPTTIYRNRRIICR